METDEERKARLEKMVATTQLTLALETDTAHVGPGDRHSSRWPWRKKEEQKRRNGFDLDLVWI